jgi:hypothetical protein
MWTEGHAVGLFRAKPVAVGAGAALLRNGLLGRGLVLDLRIVGPTRKRGRDQDFVCEFVVEVRLDDTPWFKAKARQRVPEYALSKFRRGESVVAVRVDPEDHKRVAIDLGTPPPSVRVAAAAGHRPATELLACGSPCDAVIVRWSALGLRSPNGTGIYAFLLTVLTEGQDPYQVRVGLPVPDNARPLLYPGSTLPARRDHGGRPDDVVIDWEKALAPPPLNGRRGSIELSGAPLASG